jgi:hypothetical protein
VGLQGDVTVERQRFCPVCDRLFNEGEAVLRCTSCGVQHHPGCWVRNNGCSTDGPHDARPSPEAYEPATRPAVAAVAAPANGGATGRPHVQPGPERPHQNGGTNGEFVIGRTTMAARPADSYHGAPPAAVQRPRAKAGRYPDLTGTASAPLPRVYPGHRLLQYWYVPAALAVAVVVAAAIIWLGDKAFGGGGDNNAAVASPAADDTPAAAPSTTTTTAVASQSPAAVATATVGGTTVPAEGLGPGASVVVGGTGDCLNVRTGAGLANDAIACLPDGTEMTVLGGPLDVDGITWWQVETPGGTGWAAQEYLQMPALTE